MPSIYGLIGYKLGHSFSKSYFTEKFNQLNLQDVAYHLFELDEIDLISELKNRKDLKGLNVTIPYKTAVLPYLESLDASASKVGAVNVIKTDAGKWVGYNSDYYGFSESLKSWLGKNIDGIRALVLGTGGASKAVCAVLSDLKINYQRVSRSGLGEVLNYGDIDNAIIEQHKLLINTTPLGMYPEVGAKPDLPYHQFGKDHFLYDLVYNPEVTEFMRNGADRGASVKNGLEMLHLQAEKSWEIWNSSD